jgi:hypothetical protein
LRMKTTFWPGFICLNGVPSCFGFSMSNPHSGRQCMTCRQWLPCAKLTAQECGHAVAGCFSTLRIVPARMFLLYGLVI